MRSPSRVPLYTLAIVFLFALPVAAQSANPWSRLDLDGDQVHDDFGASVAVWRNLVLAGSPGNNSTDSYAGSAHLFTRGPAGWRKVLDLVPADGSGEPAFGTSVAVGDKVLAVGAPGFFISGRSTGFVEVYHRRGAWWQRAAILEASDAVQGSRFGGAVALDGDTLAVGAPGTSVFPGTPGAVYIFRRQSAGWVETQKLSGRPFDTGAEFGFALSLQGNTLAVGAPWERHDRSDGDVGTVYVYRRRGLDFELQQQIRGGDAESQVFGRSISLSGDRIAIGSPAVGPGISGESTVFVFTENAGVWTRTAKLRPVTADSSDRYAYAVALQGNRLYVSAHLTPIPTKNPHEIEGHGVVYTFRRRGGEWLPGRPLRPAGYPGHFGQPLAISGWGLVAGAPHPSPSVSAVFVLRTWGTRQ